MATCIYCLKDKKPHEFNREHVLPVAFGKYKNNLVLHQTVCRECNDYFGNRLDHGLARESLEGLERFQWGIKPPAEVHKFRYSRVRLAAEVSGDFEGCLLELREDPHSPDGVKAVPMPQVGFAKKSGAGFVYFPLPELEGGLWRDDPSIDPQQGVKIISADEEAVKAALERFGIRFRQWRPLEQPEDVSTVNIGHIIRFTHDHMRAVAKIAFNYLAWVHGAEYAVREEFDSTRRYIRLGVEPFLPAVHLSQGEIFRPDVGASENERAVAHILTITKPLNANVTLGQVTLFNWIRYDVVLAYSVVPDLIEKGHLFEPRGRAVYELGKKQKGTLS